MTSPSPDEYARSCLEAYTDAGLTVLFTRTAPENDPKRFGEWKGDRLTNHGFAAGLAARCATRNLGVLLHDSGLLAIDADSLEAREWLTEHAGWLPPTVTTRTVRGWHYLYRVDEGTRPCKLEVGADLGLRRTDRGIVLLPPSRRPDAGGYVYQFEPGRAPWEVGFTRLTAEQVERLVDLFPRSGPAATVPDGPIPEGGRHNTLVTLAGRMRRPGLSTQAIAAALHVENRERCRPPLPDDEVERIAHDIGGKEPGDPVAPATTDAPAGGVEFIDWTQFWTRDHEPEQWLYRNVIARGRAHSLYARHGRGKSLFTLWVARQVVADGHVVIYCDYEMTDADIRERLEDMGCGPDTDLSRLRYASLPGLPGLDTPEGGDALVAVVERVQEASPGLHVMLVIDTYGRAVDGKEDSSDTTRAFYRHTGLRLKQAGVTWVRIDHSGWDESRGARGSSGKGDDVDVVWLLEEKDGGLDLVRKKTRMPWVPDRVSLGKHDDPFLSYRPEANWPAGTYEAAADLDAIGYPLDGSISDAQKALKNAGRGRRRSAIGAAIRYRRTRPGTTGTTPGTTPTDPTGTTPGTTPRKPSNHAAEPPREPPGTTQAGEWEPEVVSRREPPRPRPAPNTLLDHVDQWEAEVAVDLNGGRL